MAKRNLPAFHPKVKYKGCAVCQHPQRDLLESRYSKWRPLTELSEMFDVPRDELVKHVRALELNRRRLQNRRDLVARVIEDLAEGVDFSEMPNKDKAQLIHALIKHEDVVEGLVVHRVKNDRPQVIEIYARTPIPGVPLEESDGGSEEKEE